MGLPIFHMTAAFTFSLLLFMSCLIQIPGAKSVLKRQGPDSATLATRHDKRIRRAVLFDLLGSLSYLEQRSIRTPTLQEYIRRGQRFVQYCLEAKWTWSDAPGLDHVLIMYLDQMFWEGLGLDGASHLIAAIKFFVTEVSRLGEFSLPRATRALKGWSLAAPALQRLPLPLEALGLILGLWLLKQPRDMVIRGFLAFICYLRPRESILQVWQLVRPTLSSQSWALLLNPLESEVPGKTNIFDETVIIDHSLWISDVLTLLTAGRQPLDPLWSHSHAQFVQAFKDAIVFWKMEWMGATLYSLRHGGASWDLLQKQRSLADIKKRGRWASDASLRRYAKESRLQHQVTKIPIHLARWGLEVIARLPKTLNNIEAPMQLPPL